MKFLTTFKHATRGILITIGSERNMRIHVCAATIVISLSILLNITVTEFIIILLLIGMVMTGEMINTSIERICNILRDRYKLPYEGSRDIRDIAAGVVWFQAIIATTIGLLIFSKYIFT